MSKARKQGSREREKKYLVAKNAKQEEIYVFIGFCSAYYIFYFILSIHTMKVLHDQKYLDTSFRGTQKYI